MDSGTGKEKAIALFDTSAGCIITLPVILSCEEWRALLTPEQYAFAWKKGTETTFTGKCHAWKEPGIYFYASCGTDLFNSVNKFDSETGRPSSAAPVSDLNITIHPDMSNGMTRTEVRCARCQAHLGHVFNDDSAPAGKRFCINSTALVSKKGSNSL